MSQAVPYKKKDVSCHPRKTQRLLLNSSSPSLHSAQFTFTNCSLARPYLVNLIRPRPELRCRKSLRARTASFALSKKDIYRNVALIYWPRENE